MSISHEPTGCETLVLELEFVHEWNKEERIHIGVLEKDAKRVDGTISFQIIYSRKDHSLGVFQACLTDSDIDEVIKGLVDAKERMRQYKSGERHD